MAKNIMDGFQRAKIIVRDHDPLTTTGYQRLQTDDILAFDMLGILVDLNGVRAFVPWGQVVQIEEIEDPDA